MAGRTMDKAGASEARFIVECFQRGWEVTQPFHHSQGYDFVFRRPGENWSTVQVKTAFHGLNGSGCPSRVVSLRRCNEKGQRAYKEGDFDFLFVVDGDNLWLIPWDYLKGYRSQLNLGPKVEPYKL